MGYDYEFHNQDPSRVWVHISNLVWVFVQYGPDSNTIHFRLDTKP